MIYGTTGYTCYQILVVPAKLNLLRLFDTVQHQQITAMQIVKTA